MSSAAAITKSSKSNLALAFISLPREKKRAMTVFYAFCRIVDDIADEPTRTDAQKRAELAAWRKSIAGEFAGEPELAGEVRAVMREYRIPADYFHEIIAGVGMDIEPASYRTFDDLRLYCHRVASVVGLASIEIFGYKNPACKQYALDLGLALQLTNILRDVGQDYANGGRIYLPLEDLERFGYPSEDLAAGRRTAQFEKLMDFEANRAIAFFDAAAVALPREDRKAMAAAEIMRTVYRRLLEQMRRDGFRVFDRRYSLARLEKLRAIAGVLLRNIALRR